MPEQGGWEELFKTIGRNTPPYKHALGYLQLLWGKGDLANSQGVGQQADRQMDMIANSHYCRDVSTDFSIEILDPSSR